MNDNLIMCISLFLIFVIILAINILTPKFTRKEIVFGVRIPEDKVDSDEIKHVKLEFIRNNLIIGIPFILLFSFLNYRFLNVGVILFTTFAFLFVSFLVYLISNRTMKDLKSQKLWLQGKKQVVTVDTNFSRSKSNMLVSVWFFLIPAVIIIVNIILGYMYYDTLPYKVPTQWDFSGNVTGYQFKSRFLIWEMPITQIFTTFMFFIVYKGIGWSKQQINSIDPEISVKKNSIFRSFRFEIVLYSLLSLIYTILTEAALFFGIYLIYNIIHDDATVGNGMKSNQIMNGAVNGLPYANQQIPDYGAAAEKSKQALDYINDMVPVLVILALTLGVILFTFYFLLLTKKFVVYLERISWGIQEISSGNFKARINVDSEDEFANIADKINKMAVDVNQIFEDNRKRNWWMHHG